MLRNTIETSKFNGTWYKLTIIERCELGTYLERKVPMDGKYNPTQISNKKNAPTSAPNEDPTPATAIAMALVATASMKTVVVSTLNFLDRMLNTEDPNMQHTIKQEKTLPKGTEMSLGTTPIIEGGHCRTKMYMAPSKKDWTIPSNRIFLSLHITLHASFKLGEFELAAVLPKFSFQAHVIITLAAPRNMSDS